MDYQPYPTKCNICGGPVSLKSDYMIYERRIGPGSIYSCNKCGARVGTHPRLPNEKNKPPRALGVLADEPMRELRIRCHGFFDTLWRNKHKGLKVRAHLYWTLAGILGVPEPQAHFAMMSHVELEDAFNIIKDNWDYLNEDARDFEQMLLEKEKKK